MFGRTFYHESLRKYVILFGTLFNDVWINRTDEEGNVKQALKVPLSYGPREKFLARIEGIAPGGEDPIDQQVATVLPRMGFEMNSFTYASDRKLPTINKFARGRGSVEDNERYQFNPVPYDIGFSLSIFVKNTTDGTKIIEQILPYFTPEWTTTVQLLDDPDVTLDIPLVITDISQDDVYEGSFEERRALIWTINFNMKGVLFGPVMRSPVIKLANVNIADSTLFTEIDDAGGVALPTTRTVTTPGQLANGEPTSNALLTVDKSEISRDENFDYIIEKVDFVANPGSE